MRMTMALLLALLTLISPPSEARGKRHRDAFEAQSTAGQFDYYVLTLSWSPVYCERHLDDRQ